VGKTTFAGEFLPNYAECRNFVNPDLIAQAMSPFAPETAAMRAGRMMLSEIGAFARRRVSFAFETTLSGRLRRLATAAEGQKYRIHIFFLWVGSADLALSRVQERVSRGGHDVPEAVVRRRFDRSMRNFLGRYRQLADSWMLIDNSSRKPVVIASMEDQDIRIMNEKVYRTLTKRYDQT
jgi:predicted ABC-type ATPase